MKRDFYKTHLGYVAAMLSAACLSLTACGGKTPAPENTPEPTKSAEVTNTPEPTVEPTIEPTVAPMATTAPTKAPTKVPTPTKAPEPLEDCIFNGNEEITMENIEILEKCPAELQKKNADVTYGEIVKTTYFANSIQKDKRVIILLPAGYTTEKKYPVLYVLHGIFGNETSMIGDGNSGFRILLGNMIAQGMAKDMIVVFPHMYSSATKADCTAIDEENTRAYDHFVVELAEDLMPFMEANYSVLTGKENTAVAGFSMGGRETLSIAFARPDLVGYACGISSAPGMVPGKDHFMDHPGMFTEDQIKFAAGEAPYLLMNCSGDKDSVVGKFPLSYHELMVKNGVSHVWWEIKGSDHGEPAISSGLYNFCKYVFQKEQ